MKYLFCVILLITIFCNIGAYTIHMDDAIEYGLDSFEFKVKSCTLTAGNNITAFQFDISFDTSLFEIEDCVLGNTLTGMFIDNEISSGHIRCAFAGAVPIIGPCDLVVFTIVPLNTCIDNLTMFDAKYNAILLDPINEIFGGSIDIRSVDLFINSCSAETIIHTQYYNELPVIVIDPDESDLIINIGNNGIGAAEDFDIHLTNNGGEVGSFDEVVTVASIAENSTMNVNINLYDFTEPDYEHHSDHPGLYQLSFTITIDSRIDTNIDETNENNNVLTSGLFYLLDAQRPNNYGWCLEDMDGSPRGISGTFGEGRDTNRFHNGLDIVCENSGETVYSVSSGKVEWFLQDPARNSYTRVTGYYNDSGERCKQIYVHTNLHNAITWGYYAGSGIAIGTEAFGDPLNHHVHFKDMSGPGNLNLNPLRTEGLINSNEVEAPLIEEVRAYPGLISDPRPNWGLDPIFSSETANYSLDYLEHQAIDIVAHADDRLGAIGNTQEYRYGVYRVGYSFWKFDEDLEGYILQECNYESFEFDDQNSINSEYYNDAYAIGTCDEDDYHIVTNYEGEDGDHGRIDLSLYTNGQFRVVAYAWDIQGNEDSKYLDFTLINHATPSGENVIEQLSECNLENNYPNPFNPMTTIFYSLPEGTTDNVIDIYNVKGQRVKSYRIDSVPGRNSIIWKGHDQTGRSVASGIYLYTLKSDGKIVDAKKMIMLK